MNQAKTASHSKPRRINSMLFGVLIGAALGMALSWSFNAWFAAPVGQQLPEFSLAKPEVEQNYMARYAVERHSNEAEFRPRRVVVFGDSTAAGTGASMPKYSVAGLISSRWPNVIVENHAADGATISDVVEAQMPRLNPDNEIDLALVMVGGNDVVRASSQGTIRDAMKRLLQGLQAQAGRIVIVTPGDVGAAPRWFKPVGLWMSHRSRLSQQAWRAAIEEEVRCGSGRLIHVDLAADPASDPFRIHPDLYYSADGLHPNDAGYRIWYERVLSSLENTAAQEQVQPCGRV